MNKIILCFMCLPMILIAQEKGGIKFESGISWEQALNRARTNNKYILLDCYTTWCGPCKAMDAEVFSKGEVGENINSQFISIRVQMDTSKLDDDKIKDWYQFAHDIRKRYTINAFPTYLLYSPDGDIINKGIGYKNAKEFISFAIESLKPEKQYFTLLSKYKAKQLDFSMMPILARLAKSLGEKNIADKIADEYVENCLGLMDENSFYTKENIRFISEFINNSKSRAFKNIFTNTKKVNDVMGDDDYAQNYIIYIIGHEEIYPKMTVGNKPVDDIPNWSKITNIISKKYNRDYAVRAVTSAKIRWYKYKKVWPEYTKNIVSSIERYGSKRLRANNLYINNEAWEIFTYSKNKREIKTAIKWMDHLFECDTASANWPTAIDTYANLLYKNGQLRPAFIWEDKAYRLTDTTYPYHKEYQRNLVRMKNGEPTWPLN